MTDNGHDPVNHPAHYTDHPSGVECIQITEHMNFNLGNAVKYLWRAGQKGETLEDLEKAVWYINREIQRVCADTGRQVQVDLEELMKLRPDLVTEVTEDEVPPEHISPKSARDATSLTTLDTTLHDDYLIPSTDLVETTNRKFRQMRAADLLPSNARKGGRIPGV